MLSAGAPSRALLSSGFTPRVIVPRVNAPAPLKVITPRSITIGDVGRQLETMDPDVGVVGGLRQRAGRRRRHDEILDDEVLVLVDEDIRAARDAAECELGPDVEVVALLRLDRDVRRDAARRGRDRQTTFPPGSDGDSCGRSARTGSRDRRRWRRAPTSPVSAFRVNVAPFGSGSVAGRSAAARRPRPTPRRSRASPRS